MSPSFNAERARTYAARLPNYVASDGFRDRVQWKKRGNANILLECDRNTNDVTEAVCVIIGEVSDERLFTGPLGNYNPQFNKLATAKYQLSLTCPAEPALADDFKKALANLSAIQEGVGAGLDNRYFLIRMDGSQTPNGMRLSSLISEARTRHLDPTERMDEESASIVVDWNMKETVDMFKLTHKMLPLKVYGPDDEPIAPEEVSRTIRGAIVEMYFRLKHYYMGNGDTKYNCFSGIMEQIIVLRRPENATPSPFREAGRKGPFRPRLIDIAPMAPLVRNVADNSKGVEKTQPLVQDAELTKVPEVGLNQCSTSELTKEVPDCDELTKEVPEKDQSATLRSAMTDLTKTATEGSAKTVAEGAVEEGKEPGVQKAEPLKASATATDASAKTVGEGAVKEGKEAGVQKAEPLKASAKIVGEGVINEEKRAAHAQVEGHVVSTGEKDGAGVTGGRQLRKGKNKAMDEAGGDEKRRREA